MILSLEGEEGTGKTSLAYTGPLKVVGFQFDMGAERALNGKMWDRWFKDLKITVIGYQPGVAKGGWFQEQWATSDICIVECPQPIQLDSVKVAGMTELWNYFLLGLGDAIQDSEVRTVVVDTMTIARRIKADAYLQKLQVSNPRERLTEIEYAAPNGAIRDIYTSFASLRKNLVVTHHLADERVEMIDGSGKQVKSKTGKRILEGLNGTNRYVDLSVRMAKDDKTKELTGQFIKCGYNLGLEGLPMQNPSWDSLCQTISDSLGGRFACERRENVGVV